MAIHAVNIDGGISIPSKVPKPNVYTVSQILELAREELGYCNKKSDSDLDSKEGNKGESPKYYSNGSYFPGRYTKYARDLKTAKYYQAKYNHNKQGYHWCDMFVDWCFLMLVHRRTGLSFADCKKEAEDLICQSGRDDGAGCSGSAAGYKNAGRFGNYPTPGAQIFFHDPESKWSHTGIVVACDDDNVYTIEGNVSQQVKYCTRPKRGGREIAGYGYPRLIDLVYPSSSITSGTIPESFSSVDVPTSEVTGNSSQDVTNQLTGVTPVPESKPLNMKYTDENPPLCCFQTTSRNYLNRKEMDKVLGILWHDTAAGNPMISRYVQPSDDDPNRDQWLTILGKNRYGNDWNHTDRSAGMNCWIGKLADGTVATVQTMPWNVKPWGCGAEGLKYSCNEAWIQFEICDDFYESEEYFNQVYEEAIQITAYLCKKYDIDPLGSVEFHGKVVPTILDHRTSYKLGVGGNHGDVRKWFSKYGKYAEGNDGMQIVRQDVANLLATASSPTILNVVKAGDCVKVNGGAVSRDGQPVKEYILNKKWNVISSVGDYAKLGACLDSSTLVLNKEYHVNDLTVTDATSVVPAAPNTGSQTNESRVWNLLLKEIKNPIGVAAMMGNLYCESNLKSINMEDQYQSKIGYDDETYTAAVDNGTYTNFIHDAVGYGLAQWTWHTRKEALLNFAKERKVSIGDMEMQCAFLCHELRTNFGWIWENLQSTNDLKSSSDLVLHKFEAPANQSDEIENIRYGHGVNYYEMFKNSCPHTDVTVYDAQDVTCAVDGYTGDKVCTSCGQVLEYGSIVPATEHSFFEGICVKCGALQSAQNSDGTGSGTGLIGRAELQQMLELLKSMLDR